MFQTATAPSFIDKLGTLCDGLGPVEVTARLRDLGTWLADDLDELETELQSLPQGASIVDASARHLLGRGGKRLRPICVAIASKLGSGFGPVARNLAVAIELIHSATLLHDDVIDLGERRRGAPTTRLVFGNTASILAGDWLLVTALRRILRTGHPALLERALGMIEEMIAAEGIQLENRRRLNIDRDDCFRVIEGKTASLFRLALFSGAQAGGLSPELCDALEHYGGHLGLSFQLIDDLLDVAGDPCATGKALFGDLREGKMTYPLVVALERDHGLRPLIEGFLAEREPQPVPELLINRVLDSLECTGALEDCRTLARARASDAVVCLASVPDGPARRALVTIAQAVVHRRR